MAFYRRRNCIIEPVNTMTGLRMEVQPYLVADQAGKKKTE